MNRRSLCIGASAATLGALMPGMMTMAFGDDHPALAAELGAAEAMRAVKRLQNSYAQYVQYGLWGEIGLLFTEDGELRWGGKTSRGHEAISRALAGNFGDGSDGLASDALHAQLVMTPVVVFDESGTRATGRWHDIVMTGRKGLDAQWGANILLADYAVQDGVWRIASLTIEAIFAGSYEDGWRNVVEDLPIVAYGYTPAQVGQPFPAHPPVAETPDDIVGRVAALNAEDAVRNLQNAYGYYLDRRMWDDIVDLFDDEGFVEVVGVGTYAGRDGVRRWLERTGPAGLRHGELHDHPQVNMTVDVAPGSGTASARGLELGMTGINGGDAYWSLTTFDNRFVFREGIWRIAAMRLVPAMKTDFFKGWAQSRIVDDFPEAPYAPDVPSPMAPEDAALSVSPLPPHPVTGRPIRLAAGLHALDELTPSAKGAGVRLSEAELGLALRRSRAWDAAENVSNAIGNYIDDFQWELLAALFTEDAIRKAPGAGYYHGRDRILRMQTIRNGPIRSPRNFIPIHLRIQPVIHVAQDGSSARLRTRLLQFNSGWDRPASLTGGIYEDRMATEDGVWKFRENVIDHIWRSIDHKGGWARVPENAGDGEGRSPDKLLAALPPDRPLDGPSAAPFPDIVEPAFHYRNPVSGRAPARLRE